MRICNCNIYIFLKALPLAASPAPIAHTIGKFLCIMHFALLLLVDGRWCIAISYLCLIISAGVSESISQDITISSSVLLKSDDLNRYTTKGNAGILYYYTILLCCHVIRGRFWREPRVHMCVFIGNGSNFKKIKTFDCYFVTQWIVQSSSVVWLIFCLEECAATHLTTIVESEGMTHVSPSPPPSSSSSYKEEEKK